MASSWTPEGGEVTQSPGRVGAAEKLCEKRKSIEKFMREEKEHSTVAAAKPSKLPRREGREGGRIVFVLPSPATASAGW